MKFKTSCPRISDEKDEDKFKSDSSAGSSKSQGANRFGYYATDQSLFAI